MQLLIEALHDPHLWNESGVYLAIWLHTHARIGPELQNVITLMGPHTLERCAWQTIRPWRCGPADRNKVEVLHAPCELRDVTNQSTSVIGIPPLSLSSLNAILFRGILKHAPFVLATT